MSKHHSFSNCINSDVNDKLAKPSSSVVLSGIDDIDDGGSGAKTGQEPREQALLDKGRAFKQTKAEAGAEPVAVGNVISSVLE